MRSRLPLGVFSILLATLMAMPMLHSLEPVAAQEWGSGDCASDRDLAPLARVSGTWSFECALSAGDSNWIRFETLERGRVTLETSGGTGDSILRLEHETGERISQDDDGGDELWSRIEQTLPSGTYYVRVTEYDARAIPEYTLTITAPDTAFASRSSTRDTSGRAVEAFRERDVDQPIVLVHGIKPFGGDHDYADWEPMIEAWRQWGWEGEIATWSYYACDTPRGPFARASAMGLHADDAGAHERHNGGPDAHQSRLDRGCPDQVPGAEESHTLQTPIEHLAYHLAWTLHERYAEEGACVKIAATSMGGLITRYALGMTEEYMRTGAANDFPERLCVTDVVTFGTPNLGSRFSDDVERILRWARTLGTGGLHPVGENGSVCDAMLQCQQMRPGSAFLASLNERFPAPRVEGDTEWTVIGSTDDRVVSTSSATGREDATRLPFDHRVVYRNGMLRGTVGHSLNGYVQHTQETTDARVTAWTDRDNTQMTSSEAPWPVRWAFLAFKHRGVGFISEPLPALQVSARASEPLSAPGEPVELAVTFTNVGDSAATFTPEVQLHALAGSLPAHVPLGPVEMLHIPAGTARTLTVRGEVPADAPAGAYALRAEATLALADGLESSRSVLPVDARSRVVSFVGVPDLELVDPTPESPTSLGAREEPFPYLRTTVRVTDRATGEPIVGLSGNAFSVELAGIHVRSALLREAGADGAYELAVAVPTLAEQASRDLHVQLVASQERIASVTGRDVVQFHESGATSASIILVLDTSGSMEGVPLESAQAAARRILDFATADDDIAVVSFAESARADLSLRKADAAGKSAAVRALEGLGADGGTSIGAGLRIAARILSEDARSDGPRAIVLLSDGQETDAPYARDVLPELPSDVRVFTVGFGEDADPDLLAGIAERTDAQYQYSPTPEELRSVYEALGGAVRGNAFILARDGRIDPGERVVEEIPLDPGVRRVDFSATVAGSELRLRLLSPAGRAFTESNASASTDVTFEERGLTKTFRVESPEPGLWLLEVEGYDVEVGEGYSVVAVANGGGSLLLDHDRPRYGLDEAVIARAVLLDDLDESAPPRVTAEVIDPRGQRSFLTLRDDGHHGDGLASDGVFAAYHVPVMDGSYTTRVTVEASETSGYPVVREARRSFTVGGSSTVPFQVTSTPDPVSVPQSGIARFTLAVTSTAGDPLVLDLGVTDFTTRGAVIPSTNARIDAPHLAVAPGDEAEFQVRLRVPAFAPPGLYEGRAILRGLEGTRHVPLTMEVAPASVSVEPDALHFGARQPGASFTREITISALGPGALDEVRVIAVGDVQDWVSSVVRVRDPGASDNSDSVTYRVTFAPPHDARPGSAAGVVYVETATGESVPVTVHGTIAPGSAGARAWFIVGLVGAFALAGGATVAVARRRGATRIPVASHRQRPDALLPPPPPPPPIPTQTLDHGDDAE